MQGRTCIVLCSEPSEGACSACSICVIIVGYGCYCDISDMQESWRSSPRGLGIVTKYVEPVFDKEIRAASRQHIA